MEKHTKSMKILTLLVLSSLVFNCAQQPTRPVKEDLSLPDFSFIGLAEPQANRDLMLLTVHVKIPYSELKFTRQNKLFVATYEVGITLADQENERIAGSIWKDTVIVATYDETRLDSRYVHAEDSYLIPAGKLSLMVRVTDLFTKKSRILSDTVDHSNMYSQDLSLGNIAILDGRDHGEEFSVLTHQTFYEIIDTLRFNIHLMGRKGPFKLQYSLFHKDELVKTVNGDLDLTGFVDTLLHFELPLEDMQYSTYSLVFSASDSEGAAVKTRARFRLNISGIGFDVGDLEQAIKQLRYIADERQIRFLLDGDEEERYNKFKAFWIERDPTPGTGPNELMDEYYRRIAFAIEAFSNVQEGWKTDRGMVYILFGAPDEIESGPFEIGTKPYEIWNYYHLGRQFLFVDETGFGDYRLTNRYSDQRDWRFRY